MLTQTLELDAFSQEARAMGKFADSIDGLGDVAMKWGQKFAEAKDSADISRAETILESAFQKQQTEQLGKPVEEWGNLWNQNQDQAKRKLAEIKFSNNAAEKVAPYLERWSTLSSLKIDNLAKKEEIKGFRADKEANALAKIASEDYEGAFAVMDESVKKGIHSAEEATLWKSRLLDDVQRKAKVQREANVASTIIQNPIGAEADLEKALETGKSELFPELTEKADIVRAYSNARSEASVYRNNIEDDLDQLILSGELTKPEDIRRVAEGILPERRILSAIETLSKTPAEIEKALAMRPTLLTMVEAYDPNKDDKDRSEYLKIKDSIRQLPEGERGELLSSLRDKWNNPKEATPVTEATSQLKTLFNKGQFGTWTEADGKMPDSEVPKFLAAGKKFAGFKNSLETWAKANPKEAADQTKVYEKLNEILAADKEIQKTKAGGSSWWWPFGSSAPSKPATSTDDVRKKIDAPPKTSKADSINKKSSKEDIAKAAQEIDFSTPLLDFS